MAGRPFPESGWACVQPLTCPRCPHSTLLVARPLSVLRDGPCCRLCLQLPSRGAPGLLSSLMFCTRCLRPWRTRVPRSNARLKPSIE